MFSVPQTPARAVSTAVKAAAVAGRVTGLALLAGLAAQVMVPIGSVPVTLQTLAVLLAGFFLRPREAAAAMGLYLAAGCLGAPVFAAGRAGLTAATGGYLLSFPVAAALVSLIGHGRHAGLGRQVGAVAAGTCVVFGFGVSWLAVHVGSFSEAVMVGLVPFVWIELAKAGVALTFVRGGRELCRARGPRWDGTERSALLKTSRTGKV